MFNFKKSNAGKIKVKLLATLLVLTLTSANFILLGSYIGEAIATEVSLKNQDNRTNAQNVKFEIYFDQTDKTKNEISKDINATDLVLYASVNVQNGGVLKNAKLELTDTNFKLQESVNKQSLNLEAIQSGRGITLELPVEIKRNENVFNLGLLDMISKITLTGEYTDNQGEIVEVNSTKLAKVSWTSGSIDEIPEEEPKPIELTQELITNKIYNIGETSKRLVQYKITSGITDNKYPIKQETIELQAPKYDKTTKQILNADQIVEGVNAVAPEKTIVSAYALNTTNPNEILNFKEYQTITEENIGYEYNNQDGKVKINIINKPNANNEITWNLEGKDEFVVTYVYPADVQVANIQSIANSKIALYDIENRNLYKKITNVESNGEEFGNIISLQSDITEKIYKGNMYIGEDTNYQTTSKIHISYADIANGIVFAETSGEAAEGVSTYFKTTKINKADAIKVLGTQGTIKVIGTPDSTNGSININQPATEQLIDLSQEIEEDYYTIVYGEYISQISIGMSSIQSEGTIEIVNEKTIKVEEAEAVAELTEIKTNTGLQVANINEETTETNLVETITSESTALFVEPVSDAEFGISKTNFSSLQENDVNFTVTLKTDDIKYNLYENPVITIAFPTEVQNVAITEEDITILNSDELQLQKLEKYIITDGNKEAHAIGLILSGKQTAYTTTNPQISINAKILADKLIPTVNRDVVMTLANGEETVTKTQSVNFEAEQGMLLATTVSNYSNENKTITSFGENIAEGILDTEKENATIATVTGTIINNTKLDSGEIKVIGKIQNTGDSINNILNSELQVKNKTGEAGEVTIYYTEDLNPNLNSNWVTSQNVNTTAYLVVCKNMQKQSAIEFTYNILIPANLTTNKNATVNYTVYANNQEYIAPVVKLQTPKEIKLDLKLTSNIEEGQTVYEGQNIKYNVKVTNNGEVDAENVSLHLLPEGLTISEGQIDNLNIKVGESVEKQIEATVNKDVTTASLTAEVKTDYLLQQAKKTITNTVEETGIELAIDKRIETLNSYTTTAQLGSLINYQIEIANTSDENLNNIQIADNLPEELKFEKAYVYKIVGEEITALDLTQIKNIYNEQTKEFKVKIDNLKAGEKLLVSIETNVEKVVDSNITNSVYVTVIEKHPDITFSITDNTKVIGMPKITSLISSNAKETLNSGDIIEYIIKVKNEGETTEYLAIEDKIPEELNVQNAYYYYEEQQEQKEVVNEFNNIIVRAIELKENQEITIKIIAQVKEIQETTTIENYTTIKGIYTDLVTDKIENTIIGTGEIPGDNPGQTPGDNPGQTPGDDPGQTPGDNPEKTYSISGVAWQDDNKNGARENEEKVLEGIVVKIINAETNKYLLDEQGKEIKQTTNKKGEYQFDNLKPGKYILVFDYNKTTYSVTAYQKTEVENTINSDARLVTEENINVTKTDILEITDNNISNIDIGLIVNPIFDLKLDKYITKVTVQNSEGTKVYKYDKTQLAKVEIPAKVLQGSFVIIEYQIDVKNEGAVKAHVDNIVDYLSPQLEFISELNTTWYQGKDNNLYCTEFANKDLEPGETVSAKLVLTKNMTNDNTGLVNNAAEIYETFNEYAYQDIDSTPANKAEEDDLSEADIIISIKTGGPMLYIGIVIVVMAILSSGLYLINKKVIKNHII